MARSHGNCTKSIHRIPHLIANDGDGDDDGKIDFFCMYVSHFNTNSDRVYRKNIHKLEEKHTTVDRINDDNHKNKMIYCHKRHIAFAYTVHTVEYTEYEQPLAAAVPWIKKVFIFMYV